MQKGQALLMMLLILGVAITVGLSVASRSVTDVNLTGTEDQSAKALQAAEAGVEKALGGVYPVNTQSGLTAVGGEAEFNVKTAELKTKADASPGHDYYKVPYDLNAGDVATINLKGYSPNPMGICWGKDNSENTSIELILYYTDDSGANTYVTRDGYSPSSPTLSGFTLTNNDGNKCPGGYAYTKKVLLNNLALKNYLFLRIRVIGNTTPQPVAVAPYGNDFPSQGKEITSTGQYGDTAQKVHVLQPTADLPFMFDSALFSGDTLSQ